MPIDRSTVVGLGLGAVLLAGAVGFGVGLPEAVGHGEEPTPSVPALPDRLDDTMVALSAVTPADAGVQTPDDQRLVEQLASAAATSDRQAAQHLESLYDAAAVRAYVDVKVMGDAQRQNPPAQMSVTVVPGEPGLVIPSGPFQVDQGGSHYDLSRINGHICATIYREQVDPMTGQPTGAAPTASSYQAECRTERDGLTYDVFSTGIEPERLADYLDLVLELTADS